MTTIVIQRYRNLQVRFPIRITDSRARGVEVLEPIAVDIAMSYPGVRVIDGFSNERPWDAGSTMWPGEHGFIRHFL